MLPALGWFSDFHFNDWYLVTFSLSLIMSFRHLSLILLHLVNISSSNLTVPNLASLFKQKLQNYQSEHNGNIVFMVDAYSTQEVVSKILHNYTRIRNFHNNPPRFFSATIMCDLLSKSVNATLISLTEYAAVLDTEKEILVEYPLVFAFTVISRLQNIYTKAISEKVDPPSIQICLTSAFNFVHCSNTRKAYYQSMSTIITMVKVADKWTWIFLIISVLSVSILIKRDTSAYLCTTIAVLITSGTSGDLRSKSVPFLIWTYACIVLTTYYLGDQTSEVISPPAESRISTFQELLQNKLSLVYSDMGLLRDAKLRVASSAETRNESGNVGVELLQLLDKARVATSENQFVNDIALEEGTASVLFWSIAMKYANLGNKVIDDQKIRNRRCYVGKELRFTSNPYFVFTGRDKQRLSTAYLNIFQAGFFQLWYKEWIGLGVARRVQDRCKYISPTRMMENRAQFRSLGMDEKFQDVVWLLLICLAFSAIVMASEIAYNINKLNYFLF